VCARRSASLTESAPLGAYWLCVRGVDDAGALLGPAEPDWPVYELITQVGDPDARVQWVRDDDARVRLAAGGQVDIDRLRGVATFTMPVSPTAAELVHPYLASVAAVAARWRGHESFHAGAVEAGGGAWVVLGGKGAGKSSLLAMLAAAGHPVLSDDVAIVDSHVAVAAGPRLIDLRDDAAAALGVGTPMGKVGLRERWRIGLDPVPSRLPLRGFVEVAWGEEAQIEPVPVATRVARLVDQRVIHRLPPRDPAFLLELAQLPMLQFRRPRDWDAMAAASERLVEAIG
jgi:hypothetical protein